MGRVTPEGPIPSSRTSDLGADTCVGQSSSAEEGTPEWGLWSPPGGGSGALRSPAHWAAGMGCENPAPRREEPRGHGQGAALAQTKPTRLSQACGGRWPIRSSTADRGPSPDAACRGGRGAVGNRGCAGGALGCRRVNRGGPESTLNGWALSACLEKTGE